MNASDVCNVLIMILSIVYGSLLDCGRYKQSANYEL